MKWTLHAYRVGIKPGLWEHIDRRLTFALSRFDTRIQKVDVYLTDQNGPKGGLDKSALITVRIRGLCEVMAQVVDNDWVVTIDRVTARMAQQICRELERSRQGSRNRIEDRRSLALVDSVIAENTGGETS